jgi:hypothetical protein
MNERTCLPSDDAIFSVFSNHAHWAHKLIFRQSLLELKFCGLLRFGSENRSFPVLEFKSELCREYVSNNAAIHRCFFPFLFEFDGVGVKYQSCLLDTRDLLTESQSQRRHFWGRTRLSRQHYRSLRLLVVLGFHHCFLSLKSGIRKNNEAASGEVASSIILIRRPTCLAVR